VLISGVARNLIGGGVYVLTSHCNFKTCVNVPHVNKAVTDFGGIPIYPRRYAPDADVSWLIVFEYVSKLAEVT